MEKELQLELSKLHVASLRNQTGRGNRKRGLNGNHWGLTRKENWIAAFMLSLHVKLSVLYVELSVLDL